MENAARKGWTEGKETPRAARRRARRKVVFEGIIQIGIFQARAGLIDVAANLSKNGQDWVARLVAVKNEPKADQQKAPLAEGALGCRAKQDGCRGRLRRQAQGKCGSRRAAASNARRGSRSSRCGTEHNARTSASAVGALALPEALGTAALRTCACVRASLRACVRVCACVRERVSASVTASLWQRAPAGACACVCSHVRG
eukprot:432262-Pleurochrysis_carterae.AAC.1